MTVEPVDAAELASVLRGANRDHLAVVPRGGGTKTGWGAPPERSNIELSVARLNKIVEHAWSDLTVTVEAGCTIAAVQDTLRTHGQRIAADPLWPEKATIGGVLSTNDTGALRLRFGGWRDLVIGTTIALPDGTLARSGGKVVKNVAGYDLSKLVTGAFGTLGVITTAIFRLHPLPQHSATMSATIDTPEAAARLVLALQDSTLAHTSLQLRAGPAGTVTVDLLIEGTTGGVDAQISDAAALARPVAFEQVAAGVWSARQALWDADGPVVKINTVVSELGRIISRVRELADAAGSAASSVFQATGTGFVRFAGAPSNWSGVVATLRDSVKPHGGSVVIVRPLAGDATDPWGAAGDAQGLMRVLKQQFDPRGILNPGRFVGGI